VKRHKRSNSRRRHIVTGVRPWQEKQLAKADLRRNKNGSEPFLAKKHGRHAPAVLVGFLPVGLKAQ
jgi:hypothetical protein